MWSGLWALNALRLFTALYYYLSFFFSLKGKTDEHFRLVKPVLKYFKLLRRTRELLKLYKSYTYTRKNVIRPEEGRKRSHSLTSRHPCHHVVHVIELRDQGEAIGQSGLPTHVKVLKTTRESQWEWKKNESDQMKAQRDDEKRPVTGQWKQRTTVKPWSYLLCLIKSYFMSFTAL